VATAIGILAGLRPTKKELPGVSAFVVNVPVRLKTYDQMPQVVAIVFTVPNQNRCYMVNYHFESDQTFDCRTMSPPSTSFWISIGVGLVQFFGGKLKYQDHGDENNFDLQVEVGTAGEKVGNLDGEEWNMFQQKLFNLQPVDITRYQDVAAYDHNDIS
jgi:hypothetical protein